MQRKFIYDEVFCRRSKGKRKKTSMYLTATQWELIKIDFNYKCAYCGREVYLEREHFVPSSKGGKLYQNNIIPACGTCNSSKGNKDFFDWFRKQYFYKKEAEEYILKHLNCKNQKTQQLCLL